MQQPKYIIKVSEFMITKSGYSSNVCNKCVSELINSEHCILSLPIACCV